MTSHRAGSLAGSPTSPTTSPGELAGELARTVVIDGVLPATGHPAARAPGRGG